MKIAFVANTCWNIYNFRKGLVQYFLSKGDSVIVLAPKDVYTSQIQEWGVKWFETAIKGTGTNPVEDIRYFLKIKSIFNRERPDVVLSYTIKSNIYSSLACKMNRIPIICNVSGLGTVFLVKGFVGKMAMKLYRIAFRSADFVFFQNKDDKKLFLSHVEIQEKRTGILPGSGINLTQFQQVPLPKHQHIQFIMISRMIVEKGVRDFAEAAYHFKNHDEVKFTLVGKLDEGHSRSIKKPELDKWISDGVLEYMDHSDKIHELISNSDVVVLPSYREGTPRTLLEGAAMGRPLLTSNVPGCRDVVRDGYNGFLFRVKNPKNLIDKIKLFITLNEKEKQQLANNSRTHVEEFFDEKIVIDKYETVIRRIIESA
ncbi:glycosyltransferase family 4 protein [Ekhidna sp.]|uniref:glycosyltransferase family 4 protein n=1 Tax=Ekhidna sp. TaxID=2608089 RepID=UPI003B50C074